MGMAIIWGGLYFIDKFCLGLCHFNLTWIAVLFLMIKKVLVLNSFVILLHFLYIYVFFYLYAVNVKDI